MHIPQLSMRQKLILFPGIIVLLPMLFFVFLAYEKGKEMVVNHIHDELQTTAATTMRDVDRMIFFLREQLEALAASPVMQAIVFGGAKGQIAKTLESAKETYGMYSGIFCVNLQGDIIATATPMSSKNQNVSNAAWFQKVVHNPEPYMESLRYDPLVKGFSVNFIFPIKSKTRKGSTSTIGFLSAHLNWSELFSITNGLRINEEGQTEQEFALLLDREDGVISGPPFSFVRQESANEHRSLFRTSLLADYGLAHRVYEGREGSFTVQSGGKTFLVGFSASRGYQDFKGTGWKILLVRDAESLFAPLIQIRNYLLILMGVIIAGMLFFHLLFVRSVIQPISKLTDVARRLAKGDFSQRVSYTAQDEMGTLGGTFNHMLDTLRETQTKLESAADRAEQEAKALAESNQALKDTQALLLQAQKMEALGNLAGGVAHEFNNLLGGILGFSDKLRTEFKDNPKASQALNHIIHSAERASDLVKRLLGVARKGQYEKKVFNINTTVREAVELLSETFDKKIAIKTRLMENLWNVCGDPEQITQVFMNLCINAKDAMPNGGELVFETENIFADEAYCALHKQLAPQKQYVRVGVSDTGVGIPDELLNKIFDPFFTTKVAGKGTGLGLAMVYGIVQNHGGIITVYTKAGEGTLFNLYFPPEFSAETLDKPHLKVQQPSIEPEKLASTSILIAEDEPVMRELLQELLADKVCRVYFACDGEEALALYQKHKKEIDLVILDVVMPKLDGFKVFYALRRDNPNLKIILSSGYAENEEISALREGKNVDFIQKPYTSEGLMQCIGKIL